MTVENLIAVAPKLLPLLPRLEKAVDTFERIVADPGVKDAIAVVEELAAILASSKQGS